MMRVHLAAPYAARALIFEYARDLCRLDLDVTASWINEEHEINSGTTGAATALSDEEVARHAATDLDDIERCDVLVLFTSASVGFPEAKSGGRHVEFGYALAKGKPVIVVGEPENVFHRLGGLVTFAGDVEVVPNWMAAIGALVGEFAGQDEPVSAYLDLVAGGWQVKRGLTGWKHVCPEHEVGDLK